MYTFQQNYLAPFDFHTAPPPVQMAVENDFSDNLRRLLVQDFRVPSSVARAIAETLLARMSDTNLHYHTPVHPMWMFQFYQQHVLTIDGPIERLDPEEQLALWFHDAIYVPGQLNNENHSADFMRSLVRNYMKPDERATQIIRDTAHYDKDFNCECPLLMDLDLCNFCFPAENYEMASDLIQMEFEPLAGTKAFLQGRKGVLEKLMARRSLYRTAVFLDHFEEKARQNIGETLKSVDKLLQK